MIELAGVALYAAILWLATAYFARGYSDTKEGFIMAKKIVDRSTSLTMNVTDEVGIPKSVTKPGVASTIQGTLKTGSILVWGIVALIVAREVQKMR